MIDAAIKVVAKQGFDGASVDEIARAAGLLDRRPLRELRGQGRPLPRRLRRARHVVRAGARGPRPRRPGRRARRARSRGSTSGPRARSSSCSSSSGPTRCAGRSCGASSRGGWSALREARRRAARRARGPAAAARRHARAAAARHVARARAGADGRPGGGRRRRARQRARPHTYIASARYSSDVHAAAARRRGHPPRRHRRRRPPPRRRGGRGRPARPAARLAAALVALAPPDRPARRALPRHRAGLARARMVGGPARAATPSGTCATRCSACSTPSGSIASASSARTGATSSATSSGSSSPSAWSASSRSAASIRGARSAARRSSTCARGTSTCWPRPPARASPAACRRSSCATGAAAARTRPRRSRPTPRSSSGAGTLAATHQRYRSILLREVPHFVRSAAAPAPHRADAGARRRRRPAHRGRPGQLAALRRRHAVARAAGVGHFPAEEAPEETTLHILEFLEA